MIHDLVMIGLGIIIGLGFFGGILAFMEWRQNRPRRHRFSGDYHDARSPFRIVATGPERIVERSEELIARTARRLMKLREK